MINKYKREHTINIMNDDIVVSIKSEMNEYLDNDLVIIQMDSCDVPNEVICDQIERYVLSLIPLTLELRFMSHNMLNDVYVNVIAKANSEDTYNPFTFKFRDLDDVNNVKSLDMLIRIPINIYTKVLLEIWRRVKTPDKMIKVNSDLMLTDSINDRRFKKMTFDDVYNVKCSLQKSSLTSEECIWFGVEDVNPRILVPDMHSPFEGAKKAIPYNLPSEVIISNRMHLNREQVKMLLPALQEFVDTGEI